MYEAWQGIDVEFAAFPDALEREFIVELMICTPNRPEAEKPTANSQ